MTARPFPGPLGRLLHRALDRLSLHHISHQAARRGYQLADDEDGLSDPPLTLHECEFERAEASFMRGDTAEALIWLERALPDSFAGLADRAGPRMERTA